VGADGEGGHGATAADIEGVAGEVQLAIQFFNKGDRVKLVDQAVPEEQDEEELDRLEESYQARRRLEDAQQVALLPPAAPPPPTFSAHFLPLCMAGLRRARGDACACRLALARPSHMCVVPALGCLAL
jgi:hypothetical protein